MGASAFRDLQRNLRAVEEAQERVASGARIRRPSDDPGGAINIMRLSSRLRGLEQHRSNVQKAEFRLSTEESSLENLTNILSRAKELAVGMATDTVDAAGRAGARQEVDQLKEAAIQIGNTRLGGSYLFGGERLDQAPLDANGATSVTEPPTGERLAEIGEGRLAPTVHNAVEIFDDTGIMPALQELSDALAADDRDRIAAARGGLQDAFDGVQELLGEVGARMKEMESTRATLDRLQVDFESFRSETRDVPLEEAVSDLAARQTAVQSALFAISRAAGLSLTDFLR
jgi:flagellar hook-associated protein 3 FlgL